MFNFPDNPVLNEEAIGADGIIYVWDGVKWISGVSPLVYLPIAGGTMTGPLILSGDPTLDLGAATKQYVDNLSFTADEIDLNPQVSTWTTVQNAISGIHTTLQTLSRGMAYVGSYDAENNLTNFVASVGIAPGPLPAANATGLHPGDYIVVTTPTDTGPMGALAVGDQLITDGTSWYRLAIGWAMATVTADMVPLSPVLGTWDTAQDAFTDLHTLHANAVLTTGSYANPAWITSLAWSKITGAPTFVDTAGSYADPAWLTSIDWSIIANVPGGLPAQAAGSPGHIQFNAGGTPNALGGSANLFWDNTNARLGIGTAAPGYPLTVDGDINITAGSVFRIDGVPLQLGVTVSDTPPAGPANGQLWFDAVSTQLFIYYVNPTPPGSQWVVAVNESGLLRDAPDDGRLYGRMGRAWVEIT